MRKIGEVSITIGQQFLKSGAIETQLHDRWQAAELIEGFVDGLSMGIWQPIQFPEKLLIESTRSGLVHRTSWNEPVSGLVGFRIKLRLLDEEGEKIEFGFGDWTGTDN